jgi:hypothetical protein
MEKEHMRREIRVVVEKGERLETELRTIRKLWKMRELRENMRGHTCWRESEEQGSSIIFGSHRTTFR